MPRRTFPRKDSVHRTTAGEVLAHHAFRTGSPVGLPVPIEMIIEQTYELTIIWDEIDEPPNTKILGQLVPSRREIVLNERHHAMFERWVGPERFTLAHELAHWIYDADHPDQQQMNFGSVEQFCYHRESSGLSEDTRIREMNANKLAAHILLPEDLVRQAPIDEVLRSFNETAEHWGVSRTTLKIRLEALGLIDEADLFLLEQL